MRVIYYLAYSNFTMETPFLLSLPGGVEWFIIFLILIGLLYFIFRMGRLNDRNKKN